MNHWYSFPEVKENWLGFCGNGNSGRGLGATFASALDENLVNIFKDFGEEKVTADSHLEKLCLIKHGVGRDMISDFTTNLIKAYLLAYTETFAKNHISRGLIKEISVSKVIFNYETESWCPKNYELPVYEGKHVILTPKDILTKDDTWISKHDLIKNFEAIPDAIPNSILREQVSNYFHKILPQDKEPSNKEYNKAVEYTIRKFPQLIDYFIKYKEDNGEKATEKSLSNVKESYSLYVEQFGGLIQLLKDNSTFYDITESSREATYNRIMFLKDVIENKGGFRALYLDGKPIKKEEDIQIMYRLTWYDTKYDVSREVNDGRGPADFKVSMGRDKTLVEFKLAKSSSLKNNLQKQLDLYKKASDADYGYYVIIYFTSDEYVRLNSVLNELNMSNNPSVIKIDARNDNKPSGSVAK